MKIETIFKNATGIAVLSAVGFAIYLIWNKFFKQSEAEKQGATTVSDETKGKGAEINVNHRSIANALYSAMKGAGTNELIIYNNIEAIKTIDDLYAVINAFGKKDGMDLSQWIYDDLNTTEILKINRILEGNKVNFKF